MAFPLGRTGRDQFVAAVAANMPLCRDHYRLVLRLDAFPATEPGQFVQVACRDLALNYSPPTELDWQPGRPIDLSGRELMSPLAMLRRPFSLAGRRDDDAGVELDLIHRVVGVGTDWLAGLKVGQNVHLLGPLGNRFELPAPGAIALLVGGGVGIPPMLYLAQRLAGRSAVAFCGALTRDLLPLTLDTAASSPPAGGAAPQWNVAEFARHGVASVVTTDDGSFGFRGFVTQALETYLEGAGYRERAAEKDGVPSAPVPPPIIYTCGPEPMMKRVAEIAAGRGIEAQVAVERAMACGMGTCQSCCIRVRKPDPAQPPLAGRDWAYRLACTDGPIFRGKDLLW